MRPRNRRRWPVGSYAELRKSDWLAAQMTLHEMDSATVARRCTHEEGRTVSRQMISKLKTGRTRRCTPQLATAICRVLNVPLDQLFVMHSVRNQIARNASSKSAA